MFPLVLLIALVPVVAAGKRPEPQPLWWMRTDEKLSNYFMSCISEYESGTHDRVGCHNNVDNQEECGLYRISESYYEECKEGPNVNLEWRACAADKGCAQQCVINYLEKHISECTADKNPTFVQYALLHKGGVAACKNRDTAKWRATKGSFQGYLDYVDICMERNPCIGKRNQGYKKCN